MQPPLCEPAELDLPHFLNCTKIPRQKQAKRNVRLPKNETKFVRRKFSPNNYRTSNSRLQMFVQTAKLKETFLEKA